MKAHKSGIVVTTDMVPAILAMIARGDRRHDVGAWFGLNQGRIKEVEDGNHGRPPLAAASELPPEGSPGPRARALREAIDQIEALLKSGGAASSIPQALVALETAKAAFDKPV